MQKVETVSEFLHAIADSAACVRIKIVDLPQCLEGVFVTLQALLGGANEVTNAFFANCRALCPRCSIWIPPNTLSGVHTTSRWGRDQVVFTNYGPQSHLLDGRCVLDSCESDEIILVWRGAESTRSQAATHLARVRQDAETNGEQPKLACLDLLNDKTVLDFTADTLWALWNHAQDCHLYLRADFPCFSESPNLILWISVVPFARNIAKCVFPRGYAAFFAELMQESGIEAGTVSVAHWIGMGATRDASYLNLALASRLDLPERQRFLIMPKELVTEV